MSRLRALVASILWGRTVRDAPRVQTTLHLSGKLYVITGRNNGCRI